ncbi:NAD(P)-binding protein [Hypomontagnella monticulosa]|nr:NAD(P)-binding protein [Hypomontagnella monticulosa]
MPASTRTILVVGATGQQGGCVLAELENLVSTNSTATTSTSRANTDNANAKIKVLALTRTASSPKAQALASRFSALDLEVVEGDTRTPEPIFAAHPAIDAVFSYTTPPDEEPQATALVDAAAAHAKNGKSKVHFVFSSVDRGGEPKSWDTPTDIPHFAEKHNVEVHLRDVANKSGGALTYTVLRPAAFMDNLNPGTFGLVFASLWNTMPASRKLQLVSVRDIGVFGAQALLHPTDPQFLDRAVGLAGDELTLSEAQAIFRKHAGRELPQAWNVVGWAVRSLVAAKNVGAMFRWFETDGYAVDIEALRQQEPRLQDLDTWFRESSKFEFAEGQK